MRGEAWFGSDHAGRALGAMRGSSARERGRRCLSGKGTASQRAAGLNVARGPLETSGALVQGAVDANVSKFPALEAGFVVMGMVARQGCVMVAAGPPNVGVFQGDFFFFSQWGRRGGGG